MVLEQAKYSFHRAILMLEPEKGRKVEISQNID
nr:hypothetical protein [uncultured archaeon]AQS34799.1 hypothetical protein [uncultured archaeon]